ncbi:hypothetical protein WUBG_14544 [Wuchereria bancrofti]|uniref:EB domain-containing protein n=1 Tax=Wuchereria bancrofti TaxID=6293 RepID=J9AK41_WUCBA|nr:hypothetical protein WUBG_14544 [Wuchereria bancrofti]
MTDGDCKGDLKCQDGWCICPEASMKMVDGNSKKVYGDSLLTTMQNNSTATNTLINDNKMMISQINLSASNIAPTAIKIPGR